MTDERAEFLASQQEYSDGRANDRQDAQERKALSQLLTVYGFKGSRKWVFEKGLMWLWTDQYPDMPVPFIARSFPTGWSFAHLFTRFTKTPIYTAFEDAQETFGESELCGVVFHMGSMGEMIAHNRIYTTFKTLITANYNNEFIYIQPYRDFLDWLVSSWRPTGGPLEA